MGMYIYDEWGESECGYLSIHLSISLYVYLSFGLTRGVGRK